MVRWGQDYLSGILREVRVSHMRIQRRWSLDAEVLRPLSMSACHVRKPAKGPECPIIRWVSRGDVSDTSGQEWVLTGPERSLWGLWFYSWWDEKALESWGGDMWTDLHFVMFSQAALCRRDYGHKILGSRLFQEFLQLFNVFFSPGLQEQRSSFLLYLWQSLSIFCFRPYLANRNIWWEPQI